MSNPRPTPEFPYNDLNLHEAARLALMKRCQLLADHVTEGQLAILARRSRAIFYSKSEVICTAGQQHSQYCFLLSFGRIGVTSVPGVEPITECGRLIGELAVLDEDRRRTATLVAQELSVALLIDYSDLVEIMTPELFGALVSSGLEVLSAMAGRIKDWAIQAQPQLQIDKSIEGGLNPQKAVRQSAVDAAQSIALSLMWLNSVYPQLTKIEDDLSPQRASGS
ncbi:MAG: hypothetical protein CO132_00610 [Candidatus Kerfeldbacteria bacterium CG_4_9_14_3_um_filter_45_8]|nr:MAG: hypothetical protein CO132_00610 [Candidatus Kerfeldbacteria bacterium CG_4_9_14_3_um_filter_45_8]